jgi:hypothetical protein
LKFQWDQEELQRRERAQAKLAQLDQRVMSKPIASESLVLQSAGFGEKQKAFAMEEMRHQITDKSTAQDILHICESTLTEFDTVETLEAFHRFAETPDNFKFRREPSFVLLLGKVQAVLVAREVSS